MAGLLALAWLVYASGANAPLFFDDAPNLAGLTDIRSAADFLAFVFRGEGPLGRPLALASFIPEAWAWPSQPEVLRRTNILIHLLNAVLVFHLARYLAAWAAPRAPVSARAWAAAATAGLWVLAPLLVSTTLLIIQRMTSLAALVQLAGLLAYTHGRTQLERRPRHGLILMSCGIGGGVALGVLVKETAVLLPVYVLVIERWLPPRSAPAPPTWWRVLFLWTPLLAVLFALLALWDTFAAYYAAREYTPLERLLTQGRALLCYLSLGLLPRASALGPFHDDFPVARGLWTPPGTAVTFLVWALLAGAAVALRRRLPVLGFGLAWFLGGHLLESTLLPLELYFEHRNYLPLIGPLFMLAVLPLLAPDSLRRILASGVAALVLIYALVSWQTASLWGSPALAARIWSLEHPRSVRATQFLSQQLLSEGDGAAAAAVLREAAAQLPEETVLALQALQLACIYDPDRRRVERLYGAALRVAASGRHGYAISDAMRKLFSFEQRKQCTDVLRTGRAKVLLDILLTNPRVTRYRATAANLLVLESEYWVGARVLDGAVRALERAYALRRNPDVVIHMAMLLADAGLHEEARRKISEALGQAPRHPVRRWLWQRKLRAVQKVLTRPDDPDPLGN